MKEPEFHRLLAIAVELERRAVQLGTYATFLRGLARVAHDEQHILTVVTEAADLLRLSDAKAVPPVAALITLADQLARRC